MALNTRSRYVHLIIDDWIQKDGFKIILNGNYLSYLQDWLKENTDFYALIYHDMDTKIDYNGVLVHKTEHTHVVFLLKENETSKKTGKKQYKRFSTILNEISTTTSFPTLLMTISVAKDWIGNCRYLLHLDSEDKYLYDKENVITSDIEMFDNFIAKQSDVLTTDSLYKILDECSYSLFNVMRRLGLDNYKKYRLVIQDIIRSQFKTLEK